eukprot:5215117-Ditylum_brightwellii.AAC.1
MCPSANSDTIQALKNAKQRVVEVIKESKEKRRKHNKKVVEIHALSGNATAKQALKSISNTEDMAQMLKKICFAEKRRKKSNLTSIQVLVSWPEMLMDIPPKHDLEDPNSTTEWKTIDLPQEIAHYLKLRNRRHFGQAQ